MTDYPTILSETNLYITLQNSNENEVYYKASTKISRNGGHVYIWEDNNGVVTKYQEVDYNRITSPTVTSATSLYLILLVWLNNIPTLGIRSFLMEFTNADLVDGTLYGLSLYVLEYNHNLGTDYISTVLYSPSGSVLMSSPITSTSGKMDASERLNWAYNDFGADIGAGTFYIQVSTP